MEKKLSAASFDAAFELPEAKAPGFDFEVVNASEVLLEFMDQVPGVAREDLKVDEAKVRAWIASGGRASPGLRVFAV